MLRRKMLLNLAPLILLFFVTAVVALWLLEGLFHDFRAQTHPELLLGRFRWLVIGLGIGFLLVLNISVMALLRMAGIILRPMDQLVEGSRRLAREDFGYRIQVDRDDEFGQLARAYNILAEQLQLNERRKMETLGQTALTLNHELNNAIAVIELQLRPLSRQCSGNPAVEKCIQVIRRSLDRMTKTVESLKHVRRIVLTDYITGVKMLDLERSVQDEHA